MSSVAENESGFERHAVMMVASCPNSATVRYGNDWVHLGREDRNNVILAHPGLSRLQCKIHPNSFGVFNIGTAKLHIEDEYGVTKHILGRNTSVNVRPMERFTLRFFPQGLRNSVAQVDVRLIDKDSATRLYEAEPHPHAPEGLFVQTLKRKHAEALDEERRVHDQNRERVQKLAETVRALGAQASRLQEKVAYLTRLAEEHARPAEHGRQWPSLASDRGSPREEEPTATGADDDATQVDSLECFETFEDFAEGQPRSP